MLGMIDPTPGTGCADGCHDRGASCIIKVPSGSTSAAARVYRISNKSNTSCEHCCRIWLISLYANSAVSQLLSYYKAPNSDFKIWLGVCSLETHSQFAHFSMYYIGFSVQGQILVKSAIYSEGSLPWSNGQRLMRVALHAIVLQKNI